MRRFLPLLVLLALAAPRADAHPVPKDHHDRTIVVHLNPTKENKVQVVVDYRLEVDELTILLDDMRPYRDEVDRRLFKDRPLAYYGEFMRIYAPILAARLSATANGKELRFTCGKREPALKDEKGESLGHVRCDFVFQAEFALADKENRLVFDETNYYEQPGKVDLALGKTDGVRVVSKIEADAALKNRAGIEVQPGDEEKLRHLEVRFTASKSAAAEHPEGTAVAPPPATTPRRQDGHEHGLLDLFRRTDVGLWVLLLLALGLGAVHALTPGHGKTLVAAYLIGERGTVWHAIILGIVTTLTHTGIVLIIALVLFCVPNSMSAGAKEILHAGLGLAMGLLVAVLGVWLLLQRLAGRADHFHIGGGHHHPHDHSHGHDHAHAHPDTHGGNGSAPGWYSLLILGITGGIIPCWDAIALLVLTVGSNEFWLALPLLLAFSAGLAGVLVLIGILVVKTRGFLGSRWGEGRLVRALPLVSAVAITAIGLWLCAQSVRGG